VLLNHDALHQQDWQLRGVINSTNTFEGRMASRAQRPAVGLAQICLTPGIADLARRMWYVAPWQLRSAGM
jgi:hypothetical protein